MPLIEKRWEPHEWQEEHATLPLREEVERISAKYWNSKGEEVETEEEAFK